MSIDWITVGAQILNFLVLIWLLKRFLYRPILDGIDAREAEISTRMGEAAKIRESAEAREAEYKAQIAGLSASRAETLASARKQAEAERDALMAEARAQVADQQAAREAHRADEARKYTADLHASGAQALLDLTRKALADLADDTLEARIAARAVTQLAGQAEALRAAAGDTAQATAWSRDALPKAVQEQLRDALGDVLPGTTLSFKTDASLSPGLTLRLGGAQIGWTVDSYMRGLDAALAQYIGPQISKGQADAT